MAMVDGDHRDCHTHQPSAISHQPSAMTDLTLAFRSLRATPVVSVVAVLSLALGIGANTAIFSLVNSLLLRTLPVAEPQHLFTVTSASHEGSAWSFAVWNEIRQRAPLFADAFACSGARRLHLTLGGGE